MDAANSTFEYRRWLPYWAVLQTDVRQTLRSWVYLLWVIVGVLAAAGYILYRLGYHNEAGATQNSSDITTHLFRWLTLGSLSLIVILAVSAISSERGTLADSVLSRGISRYQYFLAKWHARSFVVLATMAGLFIAVFLGSYLLLNDDLSIGGGITAIAAVCAVMAAIVACGVTIGALTQSTVLGITVLGMGLATVSVSLSVLPGHYGSTVRSFNLLPTFSDHDTGADRSPEPAKRSLNLLTSTLKGDGSVYAFEELFAACGLISLASASVGVIVFSRKDV